MKNIVKLVGLPLILLVTVIYAALGRAESLSERQIEGQAILVGRISYVEGQLLRYDPDQEDWIATVTDSPFGLEDALRTMEKTRAEFILPNNAWVRTDSDTHIQFMVFNDEVTGIDVKSGNARFYNKGTDIVIKVTTPFGHVTVPAGASFDLDVGDDSLEVSALKGTVYFHHNTDNTRFEVTDSSSSIIANHHRVASGEYTQDFAWKRWNRSRDRLWQKRAKLNGESIDYLPSALHHEAYVLEKYGRWTRVYYDGGYYYFWRPVFVGIGWTPFTVGRWTLWYGDHCWIPEEPFGYITHHYGNWIFMGGFWYWAPPVARVRMRLGPPLLNIEFAWYPGRVAWVHSGIHIGWIPLDPRESYFCHRRWGRQAVVVNNIHMKKININIKNYKYLNHAVVIQGKNFFGVKNYRKLRIRNIKSATLINAYHATPGFDKRMLKNYQSIRQRHNFTDVEVHTTQHGMISKEIRYKQLADKRNFHIKAKKREKDATNARRDILAKSDPQRNVAFHKKPAFMTHNKKTERKLKSKDRKIDNKVKSLEEKNDPDTNKLQQRRRKGLLKSSINQPGKLKNQTEVGRPTQKAQRREPSTIVQKTGEILKNQMRGGGLIQRNKRNKLDKFVPRIKGEKRIQQHRGRGQF